MSSGADDVKIDVSLGVGLNTKPDPRALQPDGLATCKNAEFNELGGAQTRRPFTALATDTLAGGNISSIRRLAAYGDELIAFTDTEIYSWSPALSVWVSRASYLAPKITERSRFVRTGDQVQQDRAELNGVAFYVWVDTSTSSTWMAALDSTTGAVLAGPTEDTAIDRPRLVPLTNKVLLFAEETASVLLYGKALDPADPQTSIDAAFTSLSSDFSGYFDAKPFSSTSAIVVWGTDTVTTTHRVAVFNESVTSVDSANPSRRADTIVSVAVSAASDVCILRYDDNANTIVADILDSALNDVSVGNTIGSSVTSPNQLTGAFRSVQNSSEYRCYGFWTVLEDTASEDNLCSYNWCDTAGTTGTEATLCREVGLASHAFDHGGTVYVWTVFAGDSVLAEATTLTAALQNTYFLWDDAATLHAKSMPARAGGFGSTDGHVPSVQNTDTNIYVFCGLERRRFSFGQDRQGYHERAPRDVVLEFDSDDARRTVQLGKTLYISGGQILQYDGTGIYEVGFHTYPWFISSAEGAAGNLGAADYTWKASWSWQNAKGEFERATTASTTQATISASKKATVSANPLQATMKTGSAGSGLNPAVEFWRTEGDPVLDSPFYLVTDSDPANQSGDNRYFENIRNSSTYTLTDNYADATIAVLETHPENGLVLGALAPPPGTILAANNDRLFVAGISDDPNRIWYSKLRGIDEVAAFNDGLTIDLPAHGGGITAMEFLNGTLTVFKERAIYSIPGDGLDNLGQGAGYGTPQLIARDVGATDADLVAYTPAGIVFFSERGWMLLNRGWTVDYAFGDPVEDFDGDTFNSCVALGLDHQLRITSTSRTLMFDWAAGQWSEWDITPVHGVLWNGTYYYTDGSTVYSQDVAHGNATNYALQLTTAWIRVDGLLGEGRIKEVAILGEYRSAHDLEVEIARDYDDSSYFDDKTWTVSPTTVGGPERVTHAPSIQRMSAIKVRITPRTVGADTDPAGEAIKLTGLTITMQPKRPTRRLPAAQRQ